MIALLTFISVENRTAHGKPWELLLSNIRLGNYYNLFYHRRSCQATCFVQISGFNFCHRPGTLYYPNPQNWLDFDGGHFCLWEEALCANKAEKFNMKDAPPLFPIKLQLLWFIFLLINTVTLPFIHQIHTPMASQLPCRELSRPPGVMWGSLSRPRTLRHTSQAGRVEIKLFD